MDIASGDLPGAVNPCGLITPVGVYTASIFGGNDEGRAMLQIVHDLAPGATLKFAAALNGIFDFANNIHGLRAAGADVIVDDIFYFADPYFQDGPISVAISDVVKSGATYFTLAGNHNLVVNSRNVGSYEAPAYRPTTCPPVIGVSWTGDCHNFNPGAGPADSRSAITMTHNGNVSVVLQWAEPWYGVGTNLDLYLVDNSDHVVASSKDVNPGTSGTQIPFEKIDYSNPGVTQRYRLVINRVSGMATPRIKYLFLQYTFGILGVKYAVSSGGDIVGPTVYGHSDSAGAISTAAIPYSDSTTPETYSSRGPATLYFGPVVNSTAAAALAVPETRQKPDVTATDGGCTTFFGVFISLACYRFYGTSAAGPHAAAVAALMLSHARAHGGSLTPALIKSILVNTALPIANDGSPQKVGAGLVNAVAAVGKVPSPRVWLAIVLKQ
jgi:hypothetical protein